MDQRPIVPGTKRRTIPSRYEKTELCSICVEQALYGQAPKNSIHDSGLLTQKTQKFSPISLDTTANIP